MVFQFKRKYILLSGLVFVLLGMGGMALATTYNYIGVAFWPDGGTQEPYPADNSVVIRGAGPWVGYRVDSSSCRRGDGTPEAVLLNEYTPLQVSIDQGPEGINGATLAPTYYGGSPYTSCPDQPGVPKQWYASTGTLNTSGLPNGTYSVRIRATDSRGASDYHTFNLVVEHPASGTACVKSNRTTSWTLWGDTGKDGSGTSATYTKLPLRDYTLYPADLAGYTRTTTPSATQSLTADGQTICFAIKYTAIPTPTPVGNIRVTSNRTTSWTLWGDTGMSGSGTSRTYNNLPLRNYTLYPADIAGYTRTTTPSSGQQALTYNGQTITFAVTYTATVIQCSGPATQSCTSGENSCGTTANGTKSHTCDTSTGEWGDWGACSASPPPTPAPVACTGAWSGYNACNQRNPGGAGTITCYGTSNQSACSGATGSIPPTPAPVACTGATSAGNSCGDTNPGGAGTITCSGTSVESSCSGATGSTPAERPNYGSTCYAVPSGANACGQKDYGTNGTYVCNGGANSGQGTSCNAVNGVTPPNSSCPAPVPAISCTPSAVGYGGSSTIGWSCTNSSSGSVPGIGSGLNSSGSTGALTSNQTYTVTCVGFNGSNPTASCPVTVSSPTVNVLANGAPMITVPWNTNVTLSWAPANASSCTALGDWSGSKSTSAGSQTTGNLRPNSVHTYAYGMRCSGNGTSADSYAYVTVNAPATPTVDLRFNNSGSPAPVSYNSSGTLSWATGGIIETSCVATGDWSGSKAVPSGSEGVGPFTALRSYTLTCTGPTGLTAVDSVAVNVTAPTTSITCSPSTVAYNGASTITWSSTNAGSCTVTPPGWTGTSGSQSTGPLTSNKTYIVACNGNGLVSNSCPVTVSAPTVTISNNQTLPWNSSPTISWTVANAGSCTATNGTTGWAGSRDASTGTHSWTSPSPITIPGTYIYSLQCSGNGSTSVVNSFVTISNPIPTAYSMTYSAPDYCSSGPGGYLAWSYSDPSGSPQTAYQIQISKTGEFSNPMYDSGKLNSSSKIFAIPNGVLQFGLGYKARILVWNTYDQPSAWSDPTSTFNTPPYAYPDVIPPYQFTWPTPPRPQQNKPLQFTDHTVFGGGNVNNRQWSWNFGDGGTSTQQSPAHTYVNIGNYTISETVTDAAGQTCSYSQSLNVQKPIPVIKEVAPK